MMELSKMLPKFEKKTRHCEVHGEYVSSKIAKQDGDVWSGCFHCMQEKIKIEDQQHTQEVLERVRQQALEKVLGRAAIPSRFMDRTLENYRTDLEGQQRALRVANRYVNNWHENKKLGTSLIFCGHHGTGKTHLAIGIVRKVLEFGDVAAFTHVLEYTRAIKQSWNDRNEPEVMQQFISPDLLVIDEVGHQYGSDAERLMLFDLINARYMESKPMILITNLMLPQLKEFLDERAQDRLREGGGTAVVFDWPSQRR